MKILVVGHAYLSLINREKWVAYKKEFPNDDVTVVTPSLWNDALFSLSDAQQADAPVGKYIHLPIVHSGNEVLHRYAWADVWRVMRTVAPDILLVEQGDNAFSYFQWIAVSLLQFRFIPRIFFTWVNWKHQWGWRYRLLWWPIELVNRFFSTAAIVGNPEAQELLREKKFKGAVLVSPQLGVSLEDVASEAKPVAVKRQKIIGFVGRLAPEKGVDVLLKAFAQVAGQFDEWSVCVVGSGREHNALVELARTLGIQEKVVFTGSVDHYRALELIKSFDIFVLPSLDIPSWKEQFGHVIIEAMMAGVPVIGSDAGAIAWVIGDAGLVVAQNNVEALREALCSYMSQEEVRVLYGARGLNRVKELYSHEVIARNIGNFLHSLA